MPQVDQTLLDRLPSIRAGDHPRERARFKAADMSEASSGRTRGRAFRVEDVFQKFIEARLKFIQVIERCALKGWPDRKSAIRSNAHLQALFYTRLPLRLTYLVEQKVISDAGWSEYTSTDQVHARVQDGWGDDEEKALRLCNEAYDRIQNAIPIATAATDPPALDGLFEMAKRDPELHAAWSKLNNTVLALDSELSLKSP
jgi:hypothetical protein